MFDDKRATEVVKHHQSVADAAHEHSVEEIGCFEHSPKFVEQKTEIKYTAPKKLDTIWRYFYVKKSKI